MDDIKLGVSRQRNPLMATLAAKTMIYRGLGSGIIRVMKEGVQVDFVNEESANQFRTIVWRTIQKGKLTIQKDNSTTQKEDVSTIQKTEITIQKENSTTQKEDENHPKEEFTTQKNESTTQKEKIATQKELTTTQKAVLDYFRKHPKANRDEAIDAIEGMTEGGIKFIISKLQQLGLLKREGGRKNGTWVVIDRE